MIRRLVPALLVAVSFSAPVAAAEIASKEQCLKGAAEVEQALASGAVPKIGDKAEAQLDQILQVVKSLCERGNFKDAGSLLVVARTMIASE